jgi:hypothetical protein
MATAATARLPPASIDSFVSALQLEKTASSAVKGFLSTNTASTYQALLDIQKAQTDLSINTCQRLQLASEIINICAGDFNVCVSLLSDATIKRVADIALVCYCSYDPANRPNGLVEASFKALRSALLFRAPTAVLCAVVKSGQLGIPANIQAQASNILTMALDEGFDVANGSLGKLLLTPSYRAQMSVGDAPTVRQLLQTLQRLHTVVADAEDLKHLIKSGFTSAQSIASAKIEDVVEILSKAGMPKQKIIGVYSEARRINTRNEQIWVDIIRTRHDIPVLAVHGTVQPKLVEPGAVTGPKGTTSSDLVNLTNLFQDMDSVQSVESTSVLSPAAYLVNLLQLLKAVPVIQTVRTSKEDSPTASAPVDALGVLSQRRPDITSIQLSQENTETPVAYMDLAIEVMEDFIAPQPQHAKGLLTASDSEDESDAEDDSETESDADSDSEVKAKMAESTHNARGSHQAKIAVYSEVLSQQLVPMSVFPYNHAIATSREHFKALGTTRRDFLHMFRSDTELAHRSFAGSVSELDCAIAKATQDRRLAAEYLSLLPADFVAITQECFQTRAFVDRLANYAPTIKGLGYRDVSRALSTAEYWGYESDDRKSAKWYMFDPLSLSRIDQVKDELLRRSGVTHAQLIKILKTNFIAGRAVITLETDGSYSEKLSAMRIQDLESAARDEKPGVLVEKTFMDLQSFIRLWRKLAWSIEETDAVISVLARKAKLSGDDSKRYYALDGEFVERVGATKELCDMTSLPIAEVLPLWGPMDSASPDSLYQRLFLKPSWSKSFPKLALKHGSIIESATIGDNFEAVLRAFRITRSDGTSLLEIEGVGLGDHWTLDLVARLYGHKTLRSILDIPMVSYKQWLKIILPEADPFLDPQSTLAAIRPWLDLSEVFPSVTATVTMLAQVSDVSAPKADDLAAFGELLKGIVALEKQYEPYLKEQRDDGLHEAQTFTRDTLHSMFAALCGEATAQSLVEFVEGMYTFIISAFQVVRCPTESDTGPDI